MSFRRTVAIFVLVLPLVFLTGCIPVANISARLSDGGVEFAICDATSVSGISVVATDKQSHDALTAWEIAGSLKLEAGATVRLGQDYPGTTVTTPETDFDPKASYVDILLLDPDGDTSPYGHFDGAELVEKRWLDNSGQMRDEPCS